MAARVLVVGFSLVAVTVIVWLADPVEELTVSQVYHLRNIPGNIGRSNIKSSSTGAWKASVRPVGLTSSEGAPA